MSAAIDDAPLYACRFVQFAAAMAIFGAGSFRFYAVAGAKMPASLSAAFETWLEQFTLVVAILALLSAVGLLLYQSAAMAGSPAGPSIPKQSRRCCSKPTSVGFGFGICCLQSFSYWLALALPG